MNRNAAGGLWTPVVLGDELVAELYLPPGEDAADLQISSVNHGYRYCETPENRALTKRGSCNVNVLLPKKSYSQTSAWRQINDIFANMGIGSQVVEGGWIRVTLVSGAPAFWTTYATVIDSRTQDPTYVLPVAP